jgi:16S rRNA (guanine527-N7)-methyltransferase
VAGRAFKAELESGIATLGLNLSGSQVVALLDYIDLLARWNRTYKLTAVAEPSAMVSRHLLDSLSVLPALAGDRVVDVGSGAGLPGIPLAIARPGMRFLLLDSNGKKTRFMTHAVGRLGLGNVQVAKARVEDYDGEGGFDTVLSRAFASLADFVHLAGSLCAAEGRLVAMKGRLRPEELAGLPVGWRIAGTQRVAVPGTHGERHLVVIDRDPGSEDR